MSSQQSDREASVSRVLKYTGLFGGVQVFYTLIAILRNKITALLLRTAGMGIIDNYGRTIDMIGAGTNMGLAFGAVPHIARLKEADNRVAIGHYVKLVRSWVLLTALLGTAVTLFLAPLWSMLTWKDLSHWAAFAALSPLVGITTLAGGETAILKGLRQLSDLARVSMLGAVSTLLITSTFYFFFRIQGIVPALVFSGGVLLWLLWRAARCHVPYEVSLTSWHFLRRGWRMIRLGLAYAIANFIAAGGEYVVRLLLMHLPSSSEEIGMNAVGVYAAGFTLLVTYARLVFMSMDADYFPRLSAAACDVSRQNITVNRQIDVLVQLISPVLPVFCWCSPLILKLLFSSEFLPAVDMIGTAAPYLFFRAVSIPIAYLALAHSSGRLYLWVESSYTLIFILTMAAGYTTWGLAGAGAALTVSYIFYLCVVAAVYHRFFSFSFDAATLRRAILQGSLLMIGLISIRVDHTYIAYGISGLAVLCSLGLSTHFLYCSTHFFSKILKYRKWQK